MEECRLESEKTTIHPNLTRTHLRNNGAEERCRAQEEEYAENLPSSTSALKIMVTHVAGTNLKGSKGPQTRSPSVLAEISPAQPFIQSKHYWLKVQESHTVSDGGESGEDIVEANQLRN
jgi:hypothetical protein